MVRGTQAIKTLLELGKSTGAFVSGRDFIMRNVPPRQRESALRLFKAFEQAAGGAALYTVVSDWFDDGVDEDGPTKLQTPYQQYQTRDRYFGSTSGRYTKSNRNYRRAKCVCNHRHKRSSNRKQR